MRWRRALQPDLLIPLLAVVLRLIPGPRVIDDAYIIFRYAQNVLAGNGLVYNPGEPVFGITTPLFALLITLLAVPTGGAAAPFPWLALGLSAVADGITCWLLIRLGAALGRRPAGILTAAIWAAAPMSVTFAIGGMETSVFILLMAATLYFHSTSRPAAAALSAGLSLTTRPDALIFIVPLTLERARQLWRRRDSAARHPPLTAGEVGSFVLPVLAWAAFAWVAYGSPVPHSVLAKASAYRLPPEAGLVRLLQHVATPFLEHQAFGTGWVAVGLVLYPVLFGLGTMSALRTRLDTWPYFAYPILYLAAFSVANPLIFRWYLAPPLPPLFLGIFLGVHRIAQDLRRPAIAWAFGLFALTLTLNGWSLRPDTGPDRPAPAMAFLGLEDIYLDLGSRLRDRLSPTQVLAAGDIGALGYASGARMLDLVGLVSPQIVRYYPLAPDDYVINYAVSDRAIADLQPDLLVLLEVYGRETVLNDPGFHHSYLLVETIPTDLYGSQGMLVYQRMGP